MLTINVRLHKEGLNLENPSYLLTKDQWRGDIKAWFALG